MSVMKRKHQWKSDISPLYSQASYAYDSLAMKLVGDAMSRTVGTWAAVSLVGVTQGALGVNEK